MIYYITATKDDEYNDNGDLVKKISKSNLLIFQNFIF